MWYTKLQCYNIKIQYYKYRFRNVMFSWIRIKCQEKINQIELVSADVSNWQREPQNTTSDQAHSPAPPWLTLFTLQMFAPLCQWQQRPNRAASKCIEMVGNMKMMTLMMLLMPVVLVRLPRDSANARMCHIRVWWEQYAVRRSRSSITATTQCIYQVLQYIP